MKAIMRFLLVYGGAVLGMAACQPYQVPEFDKVIFNCQDKTIGKASKYSYTIMVSSDQCNAVVKADEKTIANRIYKLDKAQFEQVKALSKKIESPGNYNKMGPNAASQEVTLMSKERIKYHLYWNKNYLPEPATTQFVQAIKGLVPDLDKLLNVLNTPTK